MKKIKDLISQLQIPSDFEGDVYGWTTNQISHAMLGAAGGVLLTAGLAFFLMPTTALLLGPALVTLAYFIWKEVPDLGRNGTFPDSLVDTCYVGIGATLAVLTPFWPVYALILVMLGLLVI